jgi:hypothetical protein
MLSALYTSTHAEEEEPPLYYCDSDKECAKKFPGTVCITVESGDSSISKCTPDEDSRPACRGGQPGLCPSYQSPTQGYLNAHCVFVAVDVDAVGDSSTPSTTDGKSSSGSSDASASTDTSESSGKRALAFMMEEATSESESGSSSDSKASSKEPTGSAKNFGKYSKVKIGKEYVTGEFKCVDISDCPNVAADKSTCEPKECGSPGAKEQCSNQGTCTYKSIQTMSKRSCMCYSGFKGEKCQQTVPGGACDVDCGMGGDCIKKKCKCKKGFDGKKVNGKQGKPNDRCSKCTSDIACQNKNSCNIETGKCECKEGFFGPVCGGTEDSCVNKNCGNGECRLLANGSSACYCKICDPECKLCDSKDCGTCPSPATTAGYSKIALFFSAVGAAVIGNLVL